MALDDEYPCNDGDFGYRPWEDGPFRGGIEDFPPSLAELPERWKIALLVVRDYRIAICPTHRVPGGKPLIAEMTEAQLLVEWVRDEGVVVCLTPLAAERLDVELDEFGEFGDPAWRPIRYDIDGQRIELSDPIVQPVQRGMVRIASVDLIPLSHKEWEQMKRAEKAREKEKEFARRAKKRQRELRRKSA